ncbi:hypothetical protein N7447_004285 [Penicillium robsamsonii]|uniref:uncharacterized protein n=1 Tax=Penicillium robsamsonii TaxID=1792511 RepID=UPI00254860A0|nr:uncharacterized protein N7447_004285 [Penicillium robsamsonii]KAJ5827522.1 hypothetical protein N7447_004285 [Penicillium robsamsonii]
MSKSKSKHRNRNANQVKQTQSPPASSSPSSRVTKSGQTNNNKNKNSNSNNHRHNNNKSNKNRNNSNNNNNNARKPQPSEVFKKHGLNSESPYAGPSNRPLANDKQAKPPFKKPQVEVQEPAESKPPPLQRAYTPKVKKPYEYVSESEFEFEYKNPTQARAPLQSQSSFWSPPLSPPTTVGPQRTTQVSEHHGRKNRESPNLDLGYEMGCEPASPSGPSRSLLQMVVGLKDVTPDSDRENGEATDETALSDEESESEREHDPDSPGSPRQKIVNLERPLPLSGHDNQHKSRGTSLSNSIAQSQSVSISQSGLGLVLPSPASSERVRGRKQATPASHPDYGQKTRQLLTSDIDTDSEPPSEAGPDSGPEPSSPSSLPSPSLLKCRLKALKRKRSNIHNSSRHKAVPLPAPPSPESLHEDDTEPMLPTEPTWSTLSPLDRPTYPEPTIPNFRILHWRGACELKRQPSPSSSQLDLVIGPESPSKSIPASEFLPQDSEFEYRDPSPTLSMTPASSPPVPPSVPQIVPRDITPSPPPQRWLLRLQWKGQKSSSRPTIWASRLRAKCYIKGGGAPLMVDGNKYPHLFAEFPPAAHNNPEWMFPDASDDDREFEPQEDGNLELPTAKRPRLGLSENLTEREESPEARSSGLGQLAASAHGSERLQSSESEQSPEVGSFPESELDLAPLLDLVTSSGSNELPELERSSDAESEQPRTPPSIRDELSIGRVRQLNKRIEEAIKRDKKDHPKHWGGSWMKEYVRGGLIKERVEVEYREKMMREKEEEAEKKERKKQEGDKKKMERERKRMEEQRIQEEREAQKRKEEEQKRQKQQEIQRRDELERRREKKREKAREMLQKSLSESQKRYMEDLGVEI